MTASKINFLTVSFKIIRITENKLILMYLFGLKTFLMLDAQKYISTISSLENSII